MPAIANGLAQRRVLTGLKGVNQRQHPLQIEDGVVARQHVGQRGARLRRRQSDGRRCHDQPQFLRPVPAQRERIAASLFQHRRQTAEERRRGVVRVSFNLGRGTKQFRITQRTADRLEDANAGDGRSRTAAKTCSHRNVTIDLDGHRRRATAGPVRDGHVAAFQRVLASDRRRAAHHRQPRPAVIAHVDDAGGQVELNGHAKRIEPAAQVGNRGGYDDGMRSGVK